MLFAACMLGACSSDDEQQVEVSQLEGRWLEVYEPGVVREGIVYYTFHATSPTTGTCLVDFCATGAPEYEIVTLTKSRMVWKIDDRKLYFERR